jgi:hypothetical protein
MKRKIKILFVLSFLTSSLFSFEILHGQDTLPEKKTGFGKKLLNMFWDNDPSRWSVRALANYKVNQFWLRNEDYELQLTPNNPAGLGFGIANSKLIVDIIFNLKTNKEAITDRLDIQGDFLIGRSYMLFTYQDYQGFNVINTATEDTGMFRRDIRTRTLNLSYFFIFNESVNVLHSIFTGVNQNQKSAGTILGGITVEWHKMDADSSIVPASSSDLFNPEAHILNYDQYGLSVSCGYSYLFALPSNWLIFLSAAPGIGLSFKTINAETITYNPSDIYQFTINADIQIGYNGGRFYGLISSMNTWFYSSLNHGNVGSSNSLKFKLILGWKLRKQE